MRAPFQRRPPQHVAVGSAGDGASVAFSPTPSEAALLPDKGVKESPTPAVSRRIAAESQLIMDVQNVFPNLTE